MFVLVDHFFKSSYGVNEMPTSPQQQIKLPSWLLEALESETGDLVLNKRSEPRRDSYLLAFLEAGDTPGVERLSVKVTNVSSRGIGFIARSPLEESREFQLTPQGVSEHGTPFEAVRVRVVHCTQTVQGYKVGGVFV